MTSRGSLLGALLATLTHPEWWALALAAFLVRGGVVVVLAPIVVAPTVAGLMSQLAPTIVGAVIAGGPDTPVGVLALATTAIVLAFLGIAAVAGTWLEATLVDDAAGDDELGLRAPIADPRPPGLGTARLLPHAVTGAVFVLAARQIFLVAYAEATSPIAPSTPFLIRVLDQVPLPVLALVVTWLLAEALGGVALRELLFARRGPDEPAPGTWTIIGAAVRRLGRPRALVTLIATDAITVLIALPGFLAGGHAWNELRTLFSDGATETGLAIGLFLFIAVVLGWLLLLSAALAWRSAVWTALVASDRPAPIEAPQPA